FLHPQTGDEYALARRERKRGEGYRGFDIDAGTDVTLEEDLQRRDLTINAMAESVDGGGLFDPFRGRDDLDARLLRHVSPAFDEDPVRVLRVARFAAKLGALGFRVAHATHRLMKDMVARGDMTHVTRERFWRELSGALGTVAPWRFFEVLHRCGALTALLPTLDRQMGQAGGHAESPDSMPMAALKRVCAVSTAPADRLAAALFDSIDSIDAVDVLLADLRADRDSAAALRRLVSVRPFLADAAAGDPGAVYELLRGWRGFDPSVDVVVTARIAAAIIDRPVLAEVVAAVLPAARAVDVARLAGSGVSGAGLGVAIADARRRAIGDAISRAGLLT
ncbi:MAG: rhodanese, partial [Gammaproteobacteria bacterium]|nr:rhodanese [Gammaproteobacteria bacterium]